MLNLKLSQSGVSMLRRFCSTGAEKYDLIVIGGGSGGLACSKEAASLGKRVCVLDFVHPSPQGTKWGLGGTCVNVGCIPKKLFHQAALIRETIKDAVYYGYDIPNANCNWEVLVTSVQSHIKSLNWGHRIKLKEKSVTYYNAKGRFCSPTKIEATFVNGAKKILTADKTVIATGTRPFYPKFPGAHHCITSDDIFTLEKPPGRTLIVGGGYIALETAGFLNSIGFDCTVMIRSIPLRDFDQQMVNYIINHMANMGIHFFMKSVPLKVEKNGSKYKVIWKDLHSEREDLYDTVVLATGRRPTLELLSLESAGVKIHKGSQKIFATNEQTNVDNIFAIGDVLHDRPELTPVAIKAGKLLARRLFNDSEEKMNYDNVPTTVFTPLEYGCVGMSEEMALHTYGDDEIEVFHAFYKPLEFYLGNRDSASCYIKVICSVHGKRKIHGLHFIGPSAGEVVQGFAVAMNCGLTYSDLENTVGIHPTCAEEFVKLNITKSSGIDPQVSGC